MLTVKDFLSVLTPLQSNGVRVKQRAAAHQVALETDEVDPHGDRAVGVAAQSLDPVHQVGTELVASFQHAQHHDVMVPQVVHDVSGQTLRPVRQCDR